jgi:hypothetical protein
MKKSLQAASLILISTLLLGLPACLQKVEKKILVYADVNGDTAPVDTLPQDTVEVKDGVDTGPTDTLPTDAVDTKDGTELVDTGTDTPKDTLNVADEHDVDATGGVFYFTVGPKVSVPPGALAAQVTITAAEVTADAGDWFTPAGPYVEFGPSGQVFAAPLLIEFPLDTALLAEKGATDFTVWTSPDGNAPWESLPHILDLAGARALVQVSHFSIFVGGYGHEIPCVPDDPDTEVCDGRDNNCDKQIDEAACAAGELCTDDATCLSGTCAPVEGGSTSQCTAEAEACLFQDGENPVVELVDGGFICTGAKDFRLCTAGALEEAADCGLSFPGNPICDAETDTCIPECDGPEDCPDDGDLCNGTSRCEAGSCLLGQEPVQCPEDSECGTFTCNAATGICDPAPANEGNACDDLDPCTLGTTCAEGLCGGGSLKDCDDDKPCTADSCDGTTGNCLNTPAETNAECDDGDPCTEGDKCGDLGCTGFPKNCEDENECTLGMCDIDTGECGQLPSVNADCDDLSECTRDDVCDADGNCKGTPFVNCADDNDCTVDSCNPLDGACLHAPAVSGTTCAYPNKTSPAACVSSATCDDAKTCVIKTMVCECQENADCLVKEDGNACNGTLVCDKVVFPYTCKVDPATVKTCPSTGDTECKKNTCNPADGSCALTAVGGGLPCDDENACTLNETCADGVCTGGTTLTCKDNKDCTTDSCNPELGCEFPAKSTDSPCEDGNACTVGDKCGLGAVCNPGTTSNCDDSDPCTTDACTFTSPFCSHTAVPGCCTSTPQCGGGTKVCFNNQCCTPSCTDKDCGDDGCGGSCGTCTEGFTCNASNKCFCATCCQGNDECTFKNLCFAAPTLPKCNAATEVKVVTFETGTSGQPYSGDGITYSSFSAPNPYTVDGSQGALGAKCLKYSGSAKNINMQIPVTIPAGAKKPSFSFWYYCKWASTMDFKVQIAVGATTLVEVNRDICPATAAWKRKTVSLGSVTGAQTIELRMINTKFLSISLDEFEVLSEP